MKEGVFMSEREQAKQIIDQLPEYKMGNLLLFLKGMQFDDNIEDDLYCQKLYEDYLNDPDPEKDELSRHRVMKYTVTILKLAEKFIVKLPKPEKERVLRAIYQLPEGNDIRELKGKKNKGLYRLRVGDYRIIYSVDNGKLIVYVIDAGNRGDIYKRY